MVRTRLSVLKMIENADPSIQKAVSATIVSGFKEKEVEAKMQRTAFRYIRAIASEHS